jgi:hypothetical protein
MGRRKQCNISEAYLRDHYHTMTHLAMSKELGCSASSVCKAIHALGLKRTEEDIQQIRHRACAKRHETWKSEKQRVEIGQEQLTKMRIQTRENIQISRTRHNLCYQRGYIYHRDYGDMSLVFYDGNTRRMKPEREEYYHKVYGINFKAEEICK